MLLWTPGPGRAGLDWAGLGRAREFSSGHGLFGLISWYLRCCSLVMQLVGVLFVLVVLVTILRQRVDGNLFLQVLSMHI